MATNTMLQTLNDAATGGLTSASNRRQIETYRVKNTNGSGGTVTINAGDWVQFDTNESGADRVLFVRTGAAGVAIGASVIGVALDSISIPEPAGAGVSVTEDCRVVVAGYVDSARVTTGVAAQAPLSVDTTLGRADAADAANVVICGVCLDTAAANVAPVYVYKRV